jgi:CPA1 family monovalent cation:H+ antiporter
MMATWGQRVRERLARGALPEPSPLCEHLRAAPADAIPKTPEGCGACIEQGTSWVDVRLCLSCGEVGCCDSSPWKHAAAHAEQCGHPVVRSFERGESWRWCYEDELLG